jgi:branched-subunit amino acid ABC-type transport system permease component
MGILPQLLVNSLITGSIYALVAAGLALAYGLLRILNFAHGHLMMCGAYAFYFFYSELAWSIPASLAATMLVASLMGVLTLQFFVTPFVRYSFLLPLVTTIALSSILEATVSLGFGVNVKSIPVAGTSSIEFYGVYITPIQIVIIASAAVILSLLAFFVHCTSIGRVIRALRENPYAAQSLGINNAAVNRGVFIVGTCLAAYAGVLIGIETNIQPTMGNSYSMKAFATMILGGLGNVWGTVIGAYILGLVENLSIGLDFGGYSVPAGYRDAFSFLIILFVLLIKPSGLFGSKARSV